MPYISNETAAIMVNLVRSTVSALDLAQHEGLSSDEYRKVVGELNYLDAKLNRLVHADPPRRRR